MLGKRSILAFAAIAAWALGATTAGAEDAKKTIKIGVVYDYSGPLAAGGSELHGLGTKIMIDYFNAHGGVAGYKIEPIYADAQSKPDVAINEAVANGVSRRRASSGTSETSARETGWPVCQTLPIRPSPATTLCMRKNPSKAAGVVAA